METKETTEITSITTKETTEIISIQIKEITNKAMVNKITETKAITEETKNSIEKSIF